MGLKKLFSFLTYGWRWIFYLIYPRINKIYQCGIREYVCCKSLGGCFMSPHILLEGANGMSKNFGSLTFQHYSEKQNKGERKFYFTSETGFTSNNLSLPIYLFHLKWDSLKNCWKQIFDWQHQLCLYWRWIVCSQISNICGNFCFPFSKQIGIW